MYPTVASPALYSFTRPVYLSLLLLASSSLSYATDEPQADDVHSADALLASMHKQHGSITLPGDFAKVNVPGGFYYLDAKDTEKLLTQGWGNPQGSGTLGMVIPESVSPMADGGWGIIITYDNDGYVSDEDANKIDYSDLLKTMKSSLSDENEERKKAGYEPIDLVGWAVTPSYDPHSHKMVWAKELKFGDSKINTLNYNVRVLGREGVLVLNGVSSINQLNDIRSQSSDIIAATEFLPGKRYSEFNSGTDKVAAYGLAALVAGGVAAKLGFFGKLFAVLLAAKKAIFLGLIAIGGGIMKFFKRNKD